MQAKHSLSLIARNKAIYILGVILFVSCKKFVEIDPPKNELTTTTVFSSNGTANAALTVIYSQMVNGSALPHGISLTTGLYSDELTNFSTDPNNISFYTNGLNPLIKNVQDLWATSYNYIYQANAILEGLKISPGVTTNVKQQLTGEAKFIRAIWYFYLVNLFGDVPLITETSYTKNSLAARTPKDEVYKQVIIDLEDAKQLLATDFVGADGVTVSTERVRANKWAAMALLARVYLYTNNTDKAEAEATDVINNTTLFSLESSLDNVFLMNSSETILQLQPAPTTGFNTPEGANFILNGPPETGAISRNTTISPQLINTFESNDNRRTSWIDSIVVGANTYRYPFKYKIATGSPTTEYSMVLRLAEQYLIRAEARAQKSDIAGSSADLNIIRNRAGLPNTTATDKSSLLLAVEHERQVELFTEWGHRWLDLKRTGRANVIMPAVSSQKGGSWSSNDQLFPIPQLDRNNNPNLSQNAGY
jgi:hypothetical protein